MKCFLIFGVLTLVTFAAGQSRPADIRRATALLNLSFARFAAADGPYYKLVKVNSASGYIEVGFFDKINAVIKDQQENIKVCDIDVWSRPWKVNGIRVKFNCAGERELVKRFSVNTESDCNVL